VSLRTIAQDGRTTFAMVRLLGPDGEPKRTIEFVAVNPGHSDESMTMRFYFRAGVAQRWSSPSQNRGGCQFSESSATESAIAPGER